LKLTGAVTNVRIYRCTWYSNIYRIHNAEGSSIQLRFFHLYPSPHTFLFPNFLFLLNPAKGHGERRKLPSGSRRSLAAKRILMYFEVPFQVLKHAHLFTIAAERENFTCQWAIFMPLTTVTGGIILYSCCSWVCLSLCVPNVINWTEFY